MRSMIKALERNFSPTFMALAAGFILLCLPAALQLSLNSYKFFIYSGMVTSSLGVIIPEIVNKCRNSSSAVSHIQS